MHSVFRLAFPLPVSQLHTLLLVWSMALPALAGQLGLEPEPSDWPVPQLKRVYLQCDRAATRTRLDPGTAALCSQVGEALLQRGFGGDFSRLLQWWRAEKQGPLAAAAAQ